MMWEIVGAGIVLYLICAAFMVVGRTLEWSFPSIWKKHHSEESEL